MDAIAAVSEKGRALWIAHARIDPKKIHVIHNGVELPDLERADEIAAEVRRELGVPSEGKVIGVVAGMLLVKGHAYVLDAFPEVLDAVPNAWLLLAGDGPRRAGLVRQAARLGIGERVKFLGHRSDVMRVIEACDIIALTSLAESMPFSLLEGMSCGKPIVASAVGGVPELVKDGVTGYLVPPGDSAAVARALIRLLQDPRKMAHMGGAALERVRSHFSVDKMLRETMEMIFG